MFAVSPDQSIPPALFEQFVHTFVSPDICCLLPDKRNLSKYLDKLPRHTTTSLALGRVVWLQVPDELTTLEVAEAAVRQRTIADIYVVTTSSSIIRCVRRADTQPLSYSLLVVDKHTDTDELSRVLQDKLHLCGRETGEPQLLCFPSILAHHVWCEVQQQSTAPMFFVSQQSDFRCRRIVGHDPYMWVSDPQAVLVRGDDVVETAGGDVLAGAKLLTNADMAEALCHWEPADARRPGYMVFKGPSPSKPYAESLKSLIGQLYGGVHPSRLVVDDDDDTAIFDPINSPEVAQLLRHHNLPNLFDNGSLSFNRQAFPVDEDAGVWFVQPSVESVAQQLVRLRNNEYARYLPRLCLDPLLPYTVASPIAAVHALPERVMICDEPPTRFARWSGLVLFPGQADTDVGAVFVDKASLRWSMLPNPNKEYLFVPTRKDLEILRRLLPQEDVTESFEKQGQHFIVTSLSPLTNDLERIAQAYSAKSGDVAVSVMDADQGQVAKWPRDATVFHTLIVYKRGPSVHPSFSLTSSMAGWR